MSRVHLLVPDQHAHPCFNNDRADLLGKLIKDLRPDVLINIGDAADMPSLCSYDKGTRGFVGRNYTKDIEAHGDFQERMWAPIKKSKKKLPVSYVFEGNHEHRIERALDLSPELDGAMGFRDLEFDRYYNHVVRYWGGSPGIRVIDGVHYAHYHVSGVMLRAIAGEHGAYTLLTKKFVSCTQAHTHTVDYAVRTTAEGRKIHGLIGGVFQDYHSEWAGVANDLWWPGVIIKRNVEGGTYDPQFIGMEALKKEYG